MLGTIVCALNTLNDWKVGCDTPPGAHGEQCALVQSVTSEDRPNVGLTMIVLKTAAGTCDSSAITALS